MGCPVFLWGNRETSLLRHSSLCFQTSTGPVFEAGVEGKQLKPRFEYQAAPKIQPEPTWRVCVVESLSSVGNIDSRGRHGIG